MSDLNLCVFTGRFGADPEIRYTPSQTAVANFSLAVNRQYKDKQTGQKVDDTQWIDFVSFGRTSEIIGEYMRKGSQCRVTGRWQKRKWEAKDGSTRYTTEIVVEDFQMLGGKIVAGPEPTTKPTTDGFEDKDLPF